MPRILVISWADNDNQERMSQLQRGHTPSKKKVGGDASTPERNAPPAKVKPSLRQQDGKGINNNARPAYRNHQHNKGSGLGNQMGPERECNHLSQVKDGVEWSSSPRLRSGSMPDKNSYSPSGICKTSQPRRQRSAQNHLNWKHTDEKQCWAKLTKKNSQRN